MRASTHAELQCRSIAVDLEVSLGSSCRMTGPEASRLCVRHLTRMSSTDSSAEIRNRSRPLACQSLHRRQLLAFGVKPPSVHTVKYSVNSEG